MNSKGFAAVVWLAVVAAVLLTALTVNALAQAEEREEELPDQPRIAVDVNLVTLRYSVKNSQGWFVNGLQREGFRVYENGVPQEVVFFESPRNASGKPGPLWLAFLLDVSGSTYATRSEEIIAAQTFLENIENFTQIGVFGFTDKLIPFQDFTTNRANALRSFSQARQHLGRTAIYECLSQLITRLSSRAPADDHKVVIIASDALDDNYHKADQVIAQAQRHNIHIYTILVPSSAQLFVHESRATDPRQLGFHEPNKLEKEDAFARLSRQTGGKHFSGIEAILDFDDTLAQINDDVYGNLYSLGYYTSQPDLEKRHRNIHIRVLDPGLQVSALFTNQPDRLDAKKKFIAALFDTESMSGMPHNLHRQFHEIGAELDILRPRREGGRIGIPFRLKISPFTLIGNDKVGVQTQLGVIGLLVDRKGNEVVRLREFFRVTLGAREIREGRGIIYTNKLFAPPGVYDFRLALLELASWRMVAFENVVRITDE
jgi:Ca-activated chloride channel homolog